VPLDARHTIFKVAQGHVKFWERAKAYNQAGNHGSLFIGLADLEQHQCPAALLSKHLPNKRSANFILRIAVRMIESWLLADRERIAAFLDAPQAKVPAEPDRDPHPKHVLVRLARQHAPPALRRDLVPEEGHSGPVGPGYRPQMERFILKQWRPQVARTRSPSLDRAIKALERAAHE
jgi:hypothetical protein